jgi:hypothetical protein
MTDSQHFRDLAAQTLRQRRNEKAGRDGYLEVAAAYKRLALDEERLRGNRLRSVAKASRTLTATAGN